MDQTVILKSGAKMPVTGYGTWQMSNDEASNAVAEALKAGYRLIDTAKIYNNEVGVGKAIKNSGLPRAEIHVTTKLWNADHGHAEALEAIDESLHKLGLEYVDLYLIHWPAEKRAESWKAFIKIQLAGKAKDIGVSNYKVEQLEELLGQSNVVPAVNQIEFHPFVYQEQKATLDFCKEKGIVVEAYSPLARTVNMDNKVLESVANSHDKSVAQVMLRWCLQHGTVSIPKSVNPERIKENLDIFDFKLSTEEMNDINTLSE